MLDLPEVVEVAERQAAGLAADIRARLSFVAGDMFVEYLPLTLISSRPSCTTGMTSAACASCYGVDNVLPPMGDTGTKLLDMLMMLSLPGKERTKVEWQALYDAAGLRVAAITPINPRSVECIIEGRPN